MSTAPNRPELAPAPRPAPAARPRRRGMLVIAAIVLVIAIGAAWAWMSNRGNVSTDDAQIEGHIVPVAARVGGYVASVRVNENQQVHAGDVLVQLDDRDLRARLAEAEAQLGGAQAVAGTGDATGEARARLAAAIANVTQAEAAAGKAESDLDRFRTLAEHNIISRQQLDQAQAAATGARAQVAAARDQAVAARASERAAGSQVAMAQASRDAAALQLSYARITAPLDGVVSRKAVEVGQLVQPGQLIMNVVPLSDIWVVANLKETQLRGVDIGDPADIRVDSDPKTRHRGAVESISPATGARFSLLPPDNASGNFTKVVQRVPVRIHLAGANDPAHPLRPGMSVKVTIHSRG